MNEWEVALKVMMALVVLGIIITSFLGAMLIPLNEETKGFHQMNPVSHLKNYLETNIENETGLMENIIYFVIAISLLINIGYAFYKLKQSRKVDSK